MALICQYNNTTWTIIIEATGGPLKCRRPPVMSWCRRTVSVAGLTCTKKQRLDKGTE
jgi:hypothetical protein